MHLAPGTEGRPSFAALVSSVDVTTAKYISCSRVQAGRQETILDLEGMVNVCDVTSICNLTKLMAAKGHAQIVQDLCRKLRKGKEATCPSHFLPRYVLP